MRAGGVVFGLVCFVLGVVTMATAPLPAYNAHLASGAAFGGLLVALLFVARGASDE